MKSVKTFSIILSFLILFFTIACSNLPKNYLKLWYENPAQEWIDALPVGNGRIGAMVFGHPVNERIQLNDDSMWPGSAEWDNPDGTIEDIEKIRDLLIRGKNKQADALLVNKFSRKGVGRSHQTLGDLFIEFDDHDTFENYRRELDLENAVVNISYNIGDRKFTQKVFASYPDQAIIVQLKSEGPGGINAKIRLRRPEDNGNPTAKTIVKDHQLIMRGEVTQRNSWFDENEINILHGVQFETQVWAVNKGGEIQSVENHLELTNVEEVNFYIVSNSSFYTSEYSLKNNQQLSSILKKDFESLLNNHEKDYHELFNRVDFKLTDDILDSLNIDQRLERIKHGKDDLGLQSILFQYGRYLLISSSRPGSNPANLQGLWNEHIMAPWNSDYHMNINLQMNYWLADVTNLGELNEPLFNFMTRLIERGKITASENFDSRGTFFPHATDLWAPTFLRSSTAYWGSSFGAAGWMMQHFWQHFRFTGDTLFLKNKVYPALNEVAYFYFDWLMEDPRDGSLIAAPSTSPENRFIMTNGDTVATCLGSAMDQQIIAEVFDNYIETCNILNIRNGFLDSLKYKRAKLRSGIEINSDGRILEWDREYEEFEKGHRHMSHLYAFHPGNAITIKENPEMIDAVRKTVEFRLLHGGGATGWSRAWLINLSSRLLDGEKAYEHIRHFMQYSLTGNLFDLHPPFQIDGNFGYTAGIAEMLIQSQEPGIIRLLPALPNAWKDGYIKGLKARGNFTVDIEWRSHKLHEAIIKSEIGGNSTIIYDDNEILIDLKPGEIFIIPSE